MSDLSREKPSQGESLSDPGDTAPNDGGLFSGVREKRANLVQAQKDFQTEASAVMAKLLPLPKETMLKLSIAMATPALEASPIYWNLHTLIEQTGGEITDLESGAEGVAFTFPRGTLDFGVEFNDPRTGADLVVSTEPFDRSVQGPMPTFEGLRIPLGAPVISLDIVAEQT